ncbi:MAG TPA: transcriptional repressor [Planctomycetes bacterium]|nr:transcriptional repressor [Planctomycetota bacterium]HIJ71988.1 transcriptional repressor [Planctomycetota bacterium]
MVSNTRQEACRLLGGAKLRRTAGRLAVLSTLIEAGRPLTHEQIRARLAEAAPDKVTIYRILENFLEVDIVHKAFLRKRAWHFELADRCTARQCHPHFTCTSCNRTYCFTDAVLPMAKSPKGFTVHHQRVQLEGLCPDCNEGERKN